MWKIIHEATAGQDCESKVFFGKNRNIVYGVIKKNG